MYITTLLQFDTATKLEKCPILFSTAGHICPTATYSPVRVSVPIRADCARVATSSFVDFESNFLLIDFGQNVDFASPGSLMRFRAITRDIHDGQGYGLAVCA